MNYSLHRVVKGNLSGKGKCFIASALGKHTCSKVGRWFVFPAGEHSLDTTQFSNLSANPCDDHLVKALKLSEQYRTKKESKK